MSLVVNKTANAAKMGETRNMYTISTENLLGKEPPGRVRGRRMILDVTGSGHI
jgi:hypothetical protein